MSARSTSEEILWFHMVEKIAEPFYLVFFCGFHYNARLVEDLLLSEDRYLHPHSQGYRIRWPRTDDMLVAVLEQRDLRVERSINQVVNDDLLNINREVVQHVLKEIVRHRSCGLDTLKRKSDGCGLEGSNPYR